VIFGKRDDRDAKEWQGSRSIVRQMLPMSASTSAGVPDCAIT
jgi:hypothetical protein